jgi:hypothetical protein
MPPDGISRIHFRDMNQAFFEAKMRVRCPAEILTILFVGAREPAIVWIEGPFRCIHHVILWRCEERTKEQICDDSTYIWI